MASRKLRWGILSTADIARKKVVPGMWRGRRSEVVAIASRDEVTARRVAADLEIPTGHGSYEALLLDPQVEAVYIPLPNHLHADWTIAAAEAGKHVLCEKPLALTSAEAQRMVDACDAAGVVLAEAFMYRHHPSWVETMRLVRSGAIGRVRAVDTWFSYFNDDPTNIRNIADVGGGALYDIGCYAINVARWVFDGEPTRVRAAIERDPISGVDVLTTGLLEFETGISTFGVSTRLEPDQRVSIYGSDGRISVEIPFNIPPDRPTHVFVTKGGDPPVAPSTECLTFEVADPYGAEADSFVAAVLDGVPLPVPPSDAVANLRVIERVFERAG